MSKYLGIISLIAVLLGLSCWMLMPGPQDTADPSSTKIVEEVESPQVDPVFLSVTGIAEVTYTDDAKAGSSESAQTLSDLKDVVSDSAEIPYEPRIYRIQLAYDEEPVSEEIEQLFLEVVRDPNRPASLIQSQRWALKNDLLNLLVTKGSDHTALRNLLGDLLKDETTDAVMRDYALQLTVVLNENSDEESEYATHWATAAGIRNPEEWDSSDYNLAATALVHLTGEYRKGSLNKPGEIRLKELTVSLLSSEDAPESARVTAMQLSGQLKLSQVEPLAFKIAQSREEGVSLRIAAIGTLGLVAQADSAEVSEFLHRIILGDNRRLRPAALKALQNIRNRKEDKLS